jgi:hypothetical protein
MLEGASLSIETIVDGVITSTNGDRYTLGSMENKHEAHGGAEPKPGDMLVAAKTSSPGAPTLVTIYGGCDCRFAIYPEPPGPN